MQIKNGPVDNDIELITQFMSIKNYNSMKQSDRNPMRVLYESLYDALKALQTDGIDEVSFNEDGFLWGMGPGMKGGKEILGIKRPHGTPIFDKENKETVITKFLVVKDDIGRESLKPIDENYRITELDTIREKVEERYKKIEINEDGYRYLDGIDADKAMKTLATLYKTQVHEGNCILEVIIPWLGHRFSGSMPPASSSSSFSLRAKPTKIYSLEDYVAQGTITESQRKSLVNNIMQKKNILVVGGTSSGKTTFCNALLKCVSEVDPMTRVGIIEDVQELQCESKDKFFLTVPPVSLSLDTSKMLTTDALLRVAMRRSPKRICVGEVRDGEAAATLLNAWNSGHSGGICTIHADNAYGGLEKVEQYIIGSNKFPNPALISKTIHLIVSIQSVTDFDDEIQSWVTTRRVEEIKQVDQYVVEQKKYYLSDV